jgi:hypothetical protein
LLVFARQQVAHGGVLSQPVWLSDTHIYVKASLSPSSLPPTNVSLLFCLCVASPPPPRRFRALKLWFTLRMYGAEKLQELVRHHIALGEWLAEQVQEDSRWGGVLLLILLLQQVGRTAAAAA